MGTMDTAQKEPIPTLQWSFEAIGTKWWIGIYEPYGDIANLQRDIAQRIEMFAKTYSRFRPDSLVTQLSQNAGSYTFPEDAPDLFSWYRQLYDQTDGVVTPLIGQTLADAGYDASYSFKTGSPVTPPAWDDVLTVQGRAVTAVKPVLLDFGAAGKGYLIDIIAQMIRGFGIKAFCVDGSGDLYSEGLAEPLQIGLENPHDASQVIGVVQLQTGALCASSGSRRQWGQYHHIINPRTLSSPTDIVAVWATAATAFIADGLTTALFFKQPHDLLALGKFEYAVLYADGHLEHSTKFPAIFF